MAHAKCALAGHVRSGPLDFQLQADVRGRIGEHTFIGWPPYSTSRIWSSSSLRNRMMPVSDSPNVSVVRSKIGRSAAKMALS